MHAHLLRHFGLDWRLGTGQLWRLGTTPLPQTSAGFAWSNLLLLTVVAPLAEWRLGSRITSLVFFGGDWLSTVPVLLGLELAAGGAAPRQRTDRNAGHRLVRGRLGARRRPRLESAAGAVQHLISATLVVATLAACAALTTR